MSTTNKYENQLELLPERYNMYLSEEPLTHKECIEHLYNKTHSQIAEVLVTPRDIFKGDKDRFVIYLRDIYSRDIVEIANISFDDVTTKLPERIFKTLINGLEYIYGTLEKYRKELDSITGNISHEESKRKKLIEGVTLCLRQKYFNMAIPKDCITTKTKKRLAKLGLTFTAQAA